MNSKTDTEKIYKGSCLCGAVKFVACNEPEWCGHCHCPSCQKATGAAFATYVGYKKENVRFEGQKPSVFNSSPGIYRQFCGTCGSTISFQGEAWPTEIHMMAVLFEEADQFRPQYHTYVKNRRYWIKGDGLKEYPTFPDR